MTRRFLLLLRSIGVVGGALGFGAACGRLTYTVMGDNIASALLTGLFSAIGFFLFFALIWVVTGKDPTDFIFPEG